MNTQQHPTPPGIERLEIEIALAEQELSKDTRIRKVRGGIGMAGIGIMCALMVMIEFTPADTLIDALRYRVIPGWLLIVTFGVLIVVAIKLPNYKKMGDEITINRVRLERKRYWRQMMQIKPDETWPGAAPVQSEIAQTQQNLQQQKRKRNIAMLILVIGLLLSNLICDLRQSISFILWIIPVTLSVAIFSVGLFFYNKYHKSIKSTEAMLFEDRAELARRQRQ